jgi:DNA-binding HxlR family transcriptional regulator
LIDQELADKLDTIIGLLNLAFAEPVQRARADVLLDPVNAAVIEALGQNSTDAGALQAAVKATTGQSERTIVRRVSELVAQGMVVRSGTGAKVQYRLSGLMGGAPAASTRGASRG